MTESKWVKCHNNHLYDPATNETCPHCPAPRTSAGPAAPAGRDDRTQLHHPGSDAANVSRPDSGKTVRVESMHAPAGNDEVSAPSSSGAGGNDRSTRLISIPDEVEEEPTSPIFGWIVVLEGRQKFRDFRIHREQTYVGASSECDIVMDDEFISSEHASIRFTDDAFWLTDLDSSNGTFVNEFSPSARIDRVQLRDGDEIRFGKVLVKFKCL
jgi:hypothetical protein